MLQTLPYNPVDAARALHDYQYVPCTFPDSTESHQIPFPSSLLLTDSDGVLTDEDRDFY